MLLTLPLNPYYVRSKLRGTILNRLRVTCPVILADSDQELYRKRRDQYFKTSVSVLFVCRNLCQKQKASGSVSIHCRVCASVPVHWRDTEVSMAFVAMTLFFLNQARVSSQSTGVNVIPIVLYWMKHLCRSTFHMWPHSARALAGATAKADHFVLLICKADSINSSATAGLDCLKPSEREPTFWVQTARVFPTTSRPEVNLLQSTCARANSNFATIISPFSLQPVPSVCSCQRETVIAS